MKILGQTFLYNAAFAQTNAHLATNLRKGAEEVNCVPHNKHTRRG